MNPLSSRALLLLVLALGASGAAAPALGGDVVSVDATATIEPPAMPAPKAGGRELAHALGADAAGVARAEIEAELRDLSSFRELLPAGGEYRLEIHITSARRSLRELGGRTGETADQMELAVESECAWFRGDTPLLTVPLSLSRRIHLDDSPLRREIENEFRSIFREMGQRAFAELYEKRFYRALDGGGAAVR